MIKVNLMRNRVSEGTSTQAVSGGGGGGGDQAREGFIKIALILIFTLGLMIWEHQNIAELNSQQLQYQNQLTQLRTKNDDLTAQADKVKDVESQAKELEDKLKLFKLLSHLRLRSVKTLDYMQSSIPEKVWLNKVDYDSDETQIDSGHFSFTGNAVSTDDLSEFVKRLEDSAYLQDVIVIKNQEVAVNKSTSIRDVLFTADVENQK